MKGHSDDVMTSDPNKQTFPLITGGATLPSLPDETLSSPSKEVESLSSNSKASIELPRLLKAREELAPAPARDSDKALKPSLPLVRRSRYKRSGPEPDPDRDQLAERFNLKEALPYQTSNFRSSTIMRSVSIQKKKDQSRLANEVMPFPLNKQRAVPIHTQPFLWSQVEESEKALGGQSLPEKFLAEKERLFQVRGQKRRMAQPTHRQKYSDLHIGGHSHSLSHKLDYREEYDKVKNAVLPSEAQDLFLGRGLTFPSSHGTNVRKKKWQERIKQDAALPSSAPPGLPNHKGSPPVKDAAQAKDSARRKQSITAPPVVKQRTERQPDVDPHHVPTSVHRTPVKPKVNRRDLRQDDSGVSTADGSTIRGARTEYRPSAGQRSLGGKGDAQKMQKVKKCGSEPLEESMQCREEKEDVVTEGGAEDKSDEKMDTEERVPEESVDDLEEITLDQPDDATNDISLPRPDSEMDIDEPLEENVPIGPILEQPYTPKPPSPNPLMSADLHLNISAEKRDALALKFTKLDSDKDGHITFKELETTFPEGLSRAQQRYIKEAYELVSASTFFGLEEFVTISCLCERLAKLTGPVRNAFENLNQSMLQQNITQFVVLFSTVDRQQTGCISLASFQELLSQALNKDLGSDTRLFNDILSTIGKTGSLSVDKVEYLVFIPYFLSYK